MHTSQPIRPRTASHDLPLLWACCALAWLAIGTAAVRAQVIKDPLPLLERPWIEATADPQVLGLFALDQHEMVRASKALRQLDDDPLKGDTPAAPSALTTLDGKSDPGAGGAGAGSAIDSGLMQRHGRLLGATQWSATGRFGGGLRLDGRGGMATPSYPEAARGQAFTLGAWFRPERPAPDAPVEAVLFCFLNSTDGTPLYELRRHSARQLALVGGGQVLAVIDAAMPDEQWTHVALIPSPPRTLPGERPWESLRLPHHVMVVVNGVAVATVDHEALAALLPRSSGQVQVGWSGEGSPGFVGLVDQVQALKGIRGFYPWQLDRFAAVRDRAVVDAPPYLRERADLLSSMALSTGNAGAPSPGKAKPATTMPGVRGGAVMVGVGHAPFSASLREPIDPARGSIEFWFSPHDWDNRTEQEIQKPLLVVPLIDINGRTTAEDKPTRMATLTLYAMTPYGAASPPIRPGAWHHVVVGWRGGERAVYLNGKPATGPFVTLDWAKDVKPMPLTEITIGRTAREGTYFGNATLVDELHVYRRPLTPPEVANAFGRYLPTPVLTPLPFAHVEMALNAVTRRAGAIVDVLDPRRGEVSAIDFALYGPNGATPIKRARVESFNDGRATGELTDLTLEYGTQRGEFAFLDKAGTTLHKATLERNRIRPAWIDNALGIHEGKVLPGWDEMVVDKGTIALSCRRITINGSGLVESLISAEREMLAAPMTVRLKDAGGAPELRPAAALPRIETQRADLVKTRGQLVGGAWKIDTAITTEFDGLMRVEMTLTPGMPPGTPADLDEMVVDLPLRNEHATFYGLWGGNSWFRSSCDYRIVPNKTGVILESKSPGVATHPGMAGSFIPFVALTDDQRGLHWFAENDEHWSKSKEISAVQLLRDESKTTLRLNVIAQRTRIEGPRTIVFGLQATPVKKLAADHRTQARLGGFGWVDGFSKQDLKADRGNHMAMMIWPDQEDWESAAKRGEVHRREYQMEHGYRGPYLYIDRLWVRTPPHAEEHAAVWFRPGFFRHNRAASDCHAWYMNEWLKRKIIAGIYIDDMWIQPSGDPSTGLAYRLPDGKAQPGFEFFDHRAHMKRLRWLFHDNGVEPYLWVHATQTLYIPALSFVDVFLDGEDRFPNWGEEADFVHKWGLPRLRFNNPRKWGVATNWMIKLGNDRFRPPGMGHWEWRQSRVYHAALALHDIGSTIGSLPALERGGVYDPASQFVGYWDSRNAIACNSADVVASVYQRGSRATVLLFNSAKDSRVVELKIDPAKLGWTGVDAAALKVSDIDDSTPPAGDDPTRMKPPSVKAESDASATGQVKDKTAAMFDEFDQQVKEEAALKGQFKYDDRNFQQQGDKLLLRVRPRDFRLIELRKP